MYEIAICDDDSAFAADLSSRLYQLFAERDADCRVTLFSASESSFGSGSGIWIWCS